MTPPPDCYFFHIPKTGGISTWQLVDWLYGADAVCPGRMWEDIIQIPPQDLAKYRAFRGHFLSYLEPYLGRKMATFTVLRDPVERTISHYAHVRRAPEHPFHAEANALTLAEFCTHPRTRHMVQNYQAAYLACPADKSPAELARSMTQEDFARYKLQLALDPQGGQFPSSEDLYRAAVNRLESFMAVGLTERLAESFSLIAHSLGCSAEVPQFEKRNVGAGRPTSIDEATVRVIRGATEVDHAIYFENIANVMPQPPQGA